MSSHVHNSGAARPRGRGPLWLLVLLLLGACAGPGAQSGPATIWFGATLSITGPTAKEGEHTLNGYKLFVETVNQRGGISVGGRAYRAALRYYDDESRPERAAELYEKLIVEDRVDLLLGPYGSGPTEAAARVAERHQIPLLAGNGSADSIFAQGLQWTFGVMTPASRYLDGIIDLAAQARPPLGSVAILAADELFARAVAEGAADYARRRGLRVLTVERYPPDAQDLTAALARVKPLRPDLLLGATHLQDALLIVRQAHALGLKPRAVGFSVGPSSPEFRRNLRAEADYIFGATQWTAALTYRGGDLWGTPAAFDRAFRARYPDSGSTTPYAAANAAVELVVYQRALEQAGRLDRAAVRDTLRGLALDTFYGPISFDAQGLNRSKTMAVEQLQPDGGSYTVYPLSMAERRALIP
jgi:branched-chain amino acid transport system substrate-binding protein